MSRLKKALFYGDSNTYGYDPAAMFGGRYPRGQRWTSILQDHLKEEWKIIDDGLPGRAIPPAGRGMEFLREMVRAEMPLDLFAVMLGTNDILGTLRPDAARTARRMEEMVNTVESVNIGDGAPMILLIAPPRIELTELSFQASYVSGDRSYTERYQEEGRKLSRYYRELAVRRGLWFADASKWDLDFAFDAVHLSEKGHAVFAEEMEKVLRRIK